MNEERHFYNIAAAKKALAYCAPLIIESMIDPVVLSRHALSKEIISKDVSKNVKDRYSRDTREERMEKIIDELEDQISYDNDNDIFEIFVGILRELGRNGLADKIEEKYKTGYIYMYTRTLYNVQLYFFLLNFFPN